MRAAVLLLLCACNETGEKDPKYPTGQCSEFHAASRDPASYVDEDPRASLLPDERSVWQSNRCDPVRAALPPLDDKHDLEEDTLKNECDAASSRVDPSIRLACRAGCFADRRHAALVAAWGRALRGVAAFDPKSFQRFAKECLSKPTDDRYRALWRCAHVPLPPKSFEVREQDRIEYTHHDNTTSTRSIGLEWMQVSHAGKTVSFTECGGSGQRWDVFYYESP